MEMNTLYKRATNGKTTQWTIEVQGNCYRTTSGYIDGQKTTTEWTCCQAKNVGKKNETSGEEQAIKEAQALHKKKIESGFFETLDSVDNETFFKPMLAKDWVDEKSKVKFPLFSQPKLDGIRCIVSIKGMYSRNGKAIVSAPHIFNALKPLFDINPDLIFDGELYADKFANDFNAICSLAKKTKPTEKDLIESEKSLQYHIYDLPSNQGTFTQRYKELSSIELPECCVLVKTEQLDNMNDVSAYYEDYIMAGYEGQMIRVDGKYENKRTKSLMKHKSFIDEEYEIIGVEEGTGNKTGMLGAFILKTKDGKTFNSNPKFNWEVCIQMWKDRDNLIGKQATVKYFNLTPDGIPRFPFVKGIRDYE